MNNSTGKPVRFFIVIFLFAFLLVSLLVWASVSPGIPLRLVDFEHYLTGSRMIWNSDNPYGRVEYFAPPWMAILIGPFLLLPIHAASVLWLLLNYCSVFLTAVISFRWTNPIQRISSKILIPAFLSLMPASLFCYITGQISPWVGCALVLFAWTLTERTGPPWIFALLAIIVTFKPHLAFIPMGLCLLEIIRNRKWKILLAITAGMIIVVIFSFITNQHWISDMVLSWRAGDYLGGQPGLAASGYKGLSDYGVPFWIFIPYVGYLWYRWKHDGLSSITMALAITVGFLIFPYSRRYDYVLFILPGCVLIKDLAWRNWLPVGIAILSLFIIPFLNVSLLTPLLLTIGLLLKFPSSDDGPAGLLNRKEPERVDRPRNHIPSIP